jgi:hypothetical protein
VHSGDCSPVYSQCGPVDSGQDVGVNVGWASWQNPRNETYCVTNYIDYGGNCDCSDCSGANK